MEPAAIPSMASQAFAHALPGRALGPCRLMNVYSCSAVFTSDDGVEVFSPVLRFDRETVVFEVYGPVPPVRPSQVLSDFRLILGEDTLYAGRAGVRNLLNTADAILVVEAGLEDGWPDKADRDEPPRAGELPARFDAFLDQWQSNCRVDTEFKEVIADMQSYLLELRLWLDQTEAALRLLPESDRPRLEGDIVRNLEQPALSVFDDLFVRFEVAANRLDPAEKTLHWAYMRRLLHPLVLCAPFAHRTFVKPLGYAGDYRMVEMIARGPLEGATIFAKLVNRWFLRQGPALAHRNRIEYLARRLVEEASRVASRGGEARVFSLGCGPVAEVEQFLKTQPISSRTHIELADFNEETLDYVRAATQEWNRRYERTTRFTYTRRSVLQYLKLSSQREDRPPETRFDFVYCAGLFDYLTDRVCQQLMDLLYSWVRPGGLLVATNVDPSNPMRQGMEALLQWTLTYRTSTDLARLKPREALDAGFSIRSELSGVNHFVEVRKPDEL
jgi:extracellular factor (EF) 3-hydroxypalmitic acid methyl ester biosynthesis protein